MKPAEANRFKKRYQWHLRLLKLQGKNQKTIDAHSRAVRRINEYFDCCPDQLIHEQLEMYFGKSHRIHTIFMGGADHGKKIFWIHSGMN